MSPTISRKRGKMAAAGASASGLILSRPVTFVTGNAKKLEEVRYILGQSIPFNSLKLDCTLSKTPFLLTYLLLSSLNFLCFFFFSWIIASVPELQGEPEDISKEKARLAAIQVFLHILIYKTCVIMFFL